MTEEILGQVISCTTAAQVWAALTAMFSSSNRARKMQIQQQLTNLKKKDMTATDYFNKMKSLADAMASIGKPFDDEEIMGYMIGGLGSEYDPLVASIQTNPAGVPLNDFFSYLLSFEHRLEQHSAQQEFHSSANNVVRYSGNRSAERGGDRGADRSGDRGGDRGADRGGDRGNDGNNNSGNRRNWQPRRKNKIKCQVCTLFGHGALTCKQRYNHAYQADGERSGNAAHIGSYQTDPNWYMDSGATDHLTSDLDRLTVQERYTGKDQVHVADGSGSGHQEGAS